MPFLDEISFGLSAKLPLILQTEATECGLASLGMVAGFHGYRVDLATLRRRYPISLKGSTLANLIEIANQLEMGARPLKLELERLDQLKLPCILHWNFNHFVVLKEVGNRTITIHDPSFGVRKISMEDASNAFTGVALELWPNTGFKKEKEKEPIKLRSLMGRVSGLHRSFAQILLLAAALEVFSLVSPFFLQWVIDNVIVSADRDLLTTLAIGFGLLMLMQQTVSAIRSWVIMYMGTTLNIQWRANVFTHLIRLPVQYFEKRHLGDVLSRFGSIEQIQHTLTTSFLEAILDGVMAIVVLVMMFIYSPMLGWIAVGAMALYALSRWIWYRPLRTATEEQIIHAAKQQSHFLETVRGVKAIKLFQRQEVRRSTWLTLVVDQVNADLRTQKLQLLFRLLNGLLFGIENILIIWLGAKLVLDGNFSVGMLMAFNAYKGQFDTRVSSLIDKFFELKMLRLQGDRLADIVMTEPEILEGRQVSLGDAELEATIETIGLQYRYSEQEPFVLDGLNLKIQAGESVAIVGPSGCGKTTLMNVLLGVLPPTGGDVLIGGVSVKQVGIDTLRQMVGTVLQDDVLFAGSISDNISFFDPQADQQWIKKCAQAAAIADEIDAMPMAYNTLVGDMGTVLSGGQKQRILLARALYKRPKILFLDEATSHLDIAKESEVNTAVKALSITRVIVAHRPETIASASRVIVLADGKEAAAMPAPLMQNQPVPAMKTLERECNDSMAPLHQDGTLTLAQLASPILERDFESDDSDLAPLGAAIDDARIVFLGQQTFGEGNIATLKSRIVRYLHEKKGFKVLAMESGCFDAECVGEAVDAGSGYVDAARGALYFMFAEAAEMEPMFGYLDAERQRADGLRLVGVDWQHSGRYSHANLCKGLQQRLSEAAPELFADETWNLFKQMTAQVVKMNPVTADAERRTRYLERLDAFKGLMLTQPPVNEPLVESPAYWLQVLKILECQARRQFGINDIDSVAMPAQIMAEYMLWLATGPYRDDKIVIWTNNTNALRHPKAPTMAAAMAATFGSDMVSIGFTADQGCFVVPGNGRTTDIAPAPLGSYEAQFHDSATDYSLIDLRQPAASRALAGTDSWRLMQYQPVGFPLLGSFDLMIHARLVTCTVRTENPTQPTQKIA